MVIAGARPDSLVPSKSNKQQHKQQTSTSNNNKQQQTTTKHDKHNNQMQIKATTNTQTTINKQPKATNKG
eukprot:4083463-Heterocapsa_arctica.AAC.1